MTNLSDLSLIEFPFKTVPPTGPTELWIGRERFLRDLIELVGSWIIKPDSGIFLLWADLGAGKTHALRHIEYRGSLLTPPAMAIYADLPKASGDFKGVFEQLIPAFPEQALVNAITSFRGRNRDSWLDHPVVRGDRYTPRVLWTLAQLGDGLQGDTARKWLRGERLSARELQLLDGVPPIRTSDDATRTLGTLCRLLVDDKRYSRVVLMLDEFQRIGESNPRKIRAINAGIHTLFNSCPVGLAIILSYSFGTPENIKFLVTDEVRSRVRKIYSLPALTETEAWQFVSHILDSRSAVRPQVVFQDSAIRAVVKRLVADTRSALPPQNLTPRNLMQAFETILDHCLNKETSPFPVDHALADAVYETPASIRIPDSR